MEKDKLDIYNQYRGHLLSARQSSFEHFDKAILTLSSGGLALSVTFLRDVVPVPNATLLSVLIGSWVLFAASILSTPVSFLVSQQAIDRQIQYAEQYYIDGDEKSFNRRNVAATATKIFNIFSAACFVLAVVCTILFVSINILREGAIMSNEGGGKKSRIIEGYVPPRMQKNLTDEADLTKGIVPSQMPKPPQGQPPATPGQGSGSNPPPGKAESK